MKLFNLILILIALSATQVIAQQVGCREPVGEYVPHDSNKVYNYVGEWPSFPGGIEAQKSFISTNIQYPKEAEKKGIQGRVIVSFIVEKNGALSKFKVLKGVDSLLDHEALRVVKLMPNWLPGKNNGVPVRCMFKIDVVYKIPDSTHSVQPSSLVEEKQDTEKIYSYLEHWPEFPGGSEARDRFIASNLKYPLEASKIQGIVTVSVLVEKDGTLSRMKIYKSVCPSLDAEALRIVSLMPKWKPAEIKGEAVSCMYKIEVLFKH